MASDPKASLIWKREAIPVSTRFGDSYFSLEGGLEEARHVFLAGNGLPGRLAAGFQVAELGFGTGLNMLVLARAAARSGAERLYFTSFEAFPMATEDIARALAAFPELAALADDFLSAWDRGVRAFRLGNLQAEVIVGDARATLPGWPGRADAWFLDGFAPGRNPELWGPELMREVAAHTAPGGSFATYSAAGHVRRSLAAAGFAVVRRQGFGRKRHMSCGVLKP